MHNKHIWKAAAVLLVLCGVLLWGGKPAGPSPQVPVIAGREGSPAGPPPILVFRRTEGVDEGLSVEEILEAREAVSFVRFSEDGSGWPVPTGQGMPGSGSPWPRPVPDGAGERSGQDPPGPSVRQAQLAAVRYAEVEPEKIARWRGLARWRRLLPSFTVGLDQDRDPTVASATAQGVTRFSIGPEQRSFGWDLGLTWHLADLVWNPEQTSIDVRSRLATQLRQEVLEAVTRLYFERKRLLAEFEAHLSDDPLLDRERALRIEELTAHLDAITGGLFSKND